MNRILNIIKEIYAEKDGENFLRENNFLTFMIFIDIFSILIIRLMQKLKLKTHPNIISIVSLLFVLNAAYLFFHNKLIIGALFFYMHYILDGVDGQWARLIHKTSKLGARLDIYIHIIGNLFMYLGLFYTQYYLKNNSFIGGFMILAHYMGVILSRSFINQNNHFTIFKRVHLYYTSTEECFLTFFLSTLFNIVNILFPISIILTYISLTILIIKQKKGLKFNKNNFKKILFP